MRYTWPMENMIPHLPKGFSADLAKKTGKSKMTISRALRGVQCSVETAKAIQAATNGKIKADVLLGLTA